jgi:hypothetical protein
MKSITSRIRTPVRRARSETYLVITLLSFAASVGLTRLFLELTGYPQLGNSELHIAHVLWGGLLLFIASLLPVIFANRWVYFWGALLSGVGVGLFIDEVGKFITQSNDYFYPPAAPIIYAFFLLTVLLYLQIRRPPPRDARLELYHALDMLEEILDHDLEPHEHADLSSRLDFIISEARHPDLHRLASALQDFISSESLVIAPRRHTLWQRLTERMQDFEARLVTQARVKAVLTGGLGAVGIWSLVKLYQLALAALSPDRLESLVSEMIALGRIASTSGMSWFSARLALEGAVGLLLVIATVYLVAGKDRRGVGLSYLGLLLNLTTVNLLVFFFDQFSTILVAAIQFSLLMLILYYRRRYLLPEVS